MTNTVGCELGGDAEAEVEAEAALGSFSIGLSPSLSACDEGAAATDAPTRMSISVKI